MANRESQQQIVHFARRYAPLVGGVEKHLHSLNQELLKRGYKVTVVTEQTNKDLPLEEIIDGIDIVRLPINKQNSLKYKLQLWKGVWAIRQVWQSATIVHIHDVFFWILPFWFFVKNNLFITFHGYEGSSIPNWRQKWWHLLAAHLTIANLCIGDFHKNWYGVQPTLVSYGAVSGATSQQAKTKPSKRLRLAYIGRLHADTGIMEYLQAAKLLQEQAVAFSLDIMGDGPLAKQVAAYIKKHQLPVTQKGFVPNAAAAMAKYDLLFVSRYLAILEALIANKPVVAHYNNQIKHDYLAMAPFAEWITIAQTPAEIAAAVQIKQTLPQTARKWAAQQTWQKMADTYEELWYGKK